MKKNIGTPDRVVRAVIGVVLIVLAFTVAQTIVATIILVAASLFCFYEAVASWCLLYQLMGRNTCPVE